MQQENKKIAKIISVEMFCQNISNKSRGFTLVELIIVITILAILGTIAYISFQGYTKDARDGARMSDIKQIYNGLSIYKTQTEKTLVPDNYINIQSGAITISYQGYAGTSVLRTLKITGGKDPGTKDYYIYTTDVNTKKAQLMTYMETSDKDVQLLSQLKDIKLLKQANAVTNTGYYQDKKIYVYGDKIGILTNNKIPLQETTTNTGIDITTLTGSITTYFGGNVYSGGVSTSTGLTLINQINGAITGKLPCNGTTYNGYTITSLQDSQSGSFTKVVNNSPLIQTGSIIATCNNGTLNYSGESTQDGCISGYIWNGSSCLLNSYFSGEGTSGNPYRINGVTSNATATIATNCEYYNLNSVTNNNGITRGTGICGDGTKECLINGIYLIDTDGNGGNNAYEAYCDMNNNRGGWTLYSVGRVNSTTSSWNFPNQTSIIDPNNTSIEKSLTISQGDSLIISSSNIVRYDFSDGGFLYYKESIPKYWWQGSSYYTDNMSGGYAGGSAIIENGSAYCSTNYSNVLSNSWTGPLTIGNITCGGPNYATRHIASGGGYCDGSCPSCRMLLNNSSMWHTPPCYASGYVVRRRIK